MQILVPGRGRPYVDGDRLDLTAPLAWTIPDVLTPTECATYIARIEQLGPTRAPISTSRGFVMDSDIRNNTRVMFDDHVAAADLFARVQSSIPTTLCNMRPVGANERFRCYRYEPGQKFAAHYDGAFARDDHERSLLTLIVYLNDDFGGGTTEFLDFEVHAHPRTGRALLVQHFLLHEGCTVTSGTKYVLRSDVMYRDGL